MAANDLIGPKQAPSGDIVGMDVRGGDAFFNSDKGPTVQAVDPISGATRYFRMIVTIQDNGDGTTSPIYTLSEVFLS